MSATTASIAAIVVFLAAAIAVLIAGRGARLAEPEPEPTGPLFDFSDIAWDWPGYPQNLDFRDSGDRLHAHLLAASRAGFTDGG